MERYERLRTCDDVRELSRGIGESLTLDYKEKLGRRRDLASDVCALANTQGGVLVVGVKDPEPEGSPPKNPGDFRGVPVEADLVHRVENQLLDAISPRVFPRIRKTEDTFRQDNVEKCFLMIEVEASLQLHQVTVERDFKCYRRAEYQNRAMPAEEVQLRMEAILSGQRATEALFEAEIARLEQIMDGPYLALLAVPALEHYLAADPGEPEVRAEIAQLATVGRHGAGRLVHAEVDFEPTGDGVRATQQYHTGSVATECRVRRNSFVTYAQTREAIDGHEGRLFLARHSPADRLWREHENQHHYAVENHAKDLAKWGRPSTVVDPAVAVRVRPDVLRVKLTDFFDLVRGVYGFGGWRGPIRLEAVMSGKGSFFPAASTTAHESIDFFALAETTEARATIEFDYESMELRRDDLVDELLRGLARNFGMDSFPG